MLQRDGTTFQWHTWGAACVSHAPGTRRSPCGGLDERASGQIVFPKHVYPLPPWIASGVHLCYYLWDAAVEGAVSEMEPLSSLKLSVKLVRTLWFVGSTQRHGLQLPIWGSSTHWGSCLVGGAAAPGRLVVVPMQVAGACHRPCTCLSALACPGTAGVVINQLGTKTSCLVGPCLCNWPLKTPCAYITQTQKQELPSSRIISPWRRQGGR